MLAVFNWTEQPRSHTFSLAGLKLPAGHPFQAFDVLRHGRPVALEGGVLRLDNEPPHSVRLIKLVDTSVPAVGPTISAHVPAEAHAGDSVAFSADASGSSTPVISYQWDFGDGTRGEGPDVAHTYTMPGIFTVRLAATGVEGPNALKTSRIAISGLPSTAFDPNANRRYKSSDQ
jgi:alpha-galactosidase